MVLLEVIIALAFIYFLLSIVASGVNEAISLIFNRRGLELKRAIHLLFDGKEGIWSEAFYGHHRIERIKEVPSKWSLRAIPSRILKWLSRSHNPIKFNPSYIESTTFADVMLDGLTSNATTLNPDQSPSTLHPDELDAVGNMRSCINALDQYNYNQFSKLFLAPSTQPQDLVNQIKADLGSDPSSLTFRDYRTKVLKSIDNYITSFEDSTQDIQHLKNKLIQLRAHPNRDLITQFVNESKDIQELKSKFSNWFDEYMDRVSGWYKRRMHFAIFWIAGLMAVCGNIDSIEITSNLITNTSYRDAVVEAAVNYYETHPVLPESSDSTFEQTIQTVKQDLKSLNELHLPIGWDVDSKFRFRKLFGFLITVFAISLGAPFWYDVMSKAIRLRSTGPVKGEKDNA